MLTKDVIQAFKDHGIDPNAVYAATRFNNLLVKISNRSCYLNDDGFLQIVLVRLDNGLDFCRCDVAEFRQHTVLVNSAEYGKHMCMEHAVPISTDGPIGHGWECSLCGSFLQAG